MPNVVEEVELQHKKAIAVYNPQDPWEQCIQEMSYKYTVQWLSAFRCKLLANSIAKLKCNDNWVDEGELGELRASFFFKPTFGQHKNTLVFVTHILFLRDILESNSIDKYLHGPIMLMSRSLSHFLFREFPVHIHLDKKQVFLNNKHLIDIGNVFISDEFSVNVENAIKNVFSVDAKKQPIVDSILGTSSSVLQKAAMKEIDEDIFAIGEHERIIRTNMKVRDKHSKDEGVVTEVEPGDTGLVFIRKGVNHELTISKNEFDLHFVVTN